MEKFLLIMALGLTALLSNVNLSHQKSVPEYYDVETSGDRLTQNSFPIIQPYVPSNADEDLLAEYESLINFLKKLQELEQANSKLFYEDNSEVRNQNENFKIEKRYRLQPLISSINNCMKTNRENKVRMPYKDCVYNAMMFTSYKGIRG